MPPSIADVIFESTEALRKAGVPDARRAAGSLLAHLLGCDRTFIISHAEDSVSSELRSNLTYLVSRRARGEPLQYIVGHQDFFGLEFEVTPDVLIPRPETELLVETALDLISEVDAPAFVADVGTGSGCVAISLLHSRLLARALAIDISEKAIEVAKKNARRHLVENRIAFIVSDCLEAIKSKPTFDLVISNPPYVVEKAVPGLQREVRDYEPRIALTPGGDGLSVIRKLLAQTPLVLKTGGYLLIEIGFDQRDVVMDLVDSRDWQLLDIYKDLQGIPRTLTLQKTAS